MGFGIHSSALVAMQRLARAGAIAVPFSARQLPLPPGKRSSRPSFEPGEAPPQSGETCHRGSAAPGYSICFAPLRTSRLRGGAVLTDRKLDSRSRIQPVEPARGCHVAALLLLSFSLVVVPASPASAACDGGRLESGAQFIQVNGVMRSFVVRAPAGSDGRTPAPVVIAFHPFGMNSQYMQSRAPIARSWREAVTVYPDAGGGSRGWQATAEGDQNADVTFFDAVVAWLDTHGCIDRAKVFALGYSNGAQFVHRLACERPGALAGIAVAAGRLPCAPAASMPVIVSHGLRDTTAPYGLAVEASAVWARRNACPAPPANGEVGCSAAAGCSLAGTAFCTYAGGHDYDPSFTAIAVEFFKNAR